MELKGLIVSVLRHVTMRNGKVGRVFDSSNGGVTSQFDEFVLVDPAIDQVFPALATRPALKLVRRNIGGQVYIHAEPINSCPSNKVGYMFGGNFVTSSDSRISEINQYPIPVHDRTETQAEYNHLSV